MAAQLPPVVIGPYSCYVFICNHFHITFIARNKRKHTKVKAENHIGLLWGEKNMYEE